MKFNIKHKTRFDRGRIYYSYGQAIITALLVHIFDQQINFGYKVLSCILTIVVIYLLGWADDSFGIVKREQNWYSEKNPVLMKILTDLEEIKKKLAA